MSPKKLVTSLNAAVGGLIYVLRTQRNMRLHFLIALFILSFAAYLNFTRLELLLLSVVITLVLVLEMVNTAIELTTNLVKNAYDPMVRVVKDIAAGAVFLSAVNAIVVGYFLFLKRFRTRVDSRVVIDKIMESSWYVTFIILVIVLFLVLTAKVFFHKGTPFRGGMPSGHAAVAFSIWTVVSFSTRNGLVIFLTFLLAFLIARSRFKDHVHTVWEVMVGAVLGIVVTILMLQLLVR